MLFELARARIVDPTHDRNGEIASLFIRDGRFVSPPSHAADVDQTLDLHGALTMAGGIDIHTHIGGGKVNLARMLMADMPEQTVWPTVQTGRRYCQMGYTTCFEPAMLLSSARHTHLELADTPYIDTGAYVVLGNENWLLEALSQGCDDHALQAFVAWSVRASQGLAVKVVNPGGIHAFKFDQRMLDVDERHAKLGITPRDIVRRLSAAVDELQLPHPLHVHASNLGVAGNIASTLATLAAAEGRRLHLTHAQFNCYSAEGPYGMGSGAESLAKYVNTHPNISLDVGQVIFGQTVTVSADAAAQYRNRVHARPRRWIVNDVECQAGCGLVPMRYEDQQYVHSLQWTIGLELMLLVEDPWRIFLTTDHPNGGPFTSYPHLIRLLMERSFRKSMLETIHPEAAANSVLRELDREYTLDEIAIVTRAAPARILGLHDRGTLRSGAVADVAAYRVGKDWESTFTQAAFVAKRGVELIRDGQLSGHEPDCETLTATPEFDTGLLKNFGPAMQQSLRMPIGALEIGENEMADLIRRPATSVTGLRYPPYRAGAEDSHAD